jgi:ABC-type transporter Mla maintaining outer membrane lipid asymmetry ATPase subunit MlaF
VVSSILLIILAGYDHCLGNLHVEENERNSHSLIEVRDLTIGYGDRLVLEGINFEVRRGEVFAILGVSGSGKSIA